MKKKMKKIPEFKTMDEERLFWESHDSTDYVDYKDACKGIFPELQMSTKVISLRLTESMLNEIKRQAHRDDISYQTYIKMLLSEKLNEKKYKKAG